MEKVNAQPGKCINQDLQDPNQIKWMITIRRNKIQQDFKATGLECDAIRKGMET